MDVAAMLGGVLFAVYGLWQWARCARCQKPRHRARRRGQIGCVGGTGAFALGLTFWFTPQSWDDAALLWWCGSAALLWLLNEWLSRG